MEKIGEPVNANPKAGSKPGAAPTTTNVSVPAAPAGAAAPAPARGGMQGGRGGASVRGGRGGAPGPARGGGGGAPPGPLYPIEGLSPYQNKCVQRWSTSPVMPFFWLNVPLVQVDHQSSSCQQIGSQVLVQPTW
jgi:replication factor A1